MMTPARISPEPDPESVGDYKIDRDIGRTRRPAIDHILALANALLLLIITSEILREQPRAVLQRRPVAPNADDIAEIRPTDFEDALEIHFVRLDDAAVRVFHGPYHPGHNGSGNLQRSRVVMRRRPPCL